MGRPKKPLQQRSNGIWVVQLWIDGKRRVKSLETRDPVKAAARAAQAIKELEAEAANAGQSRWAADTPAIQWDIPTLPDGSNDYEQAVAKETTWGQLAASDDQIKQLDWRDLVREAESVIKRKTGKPFSDSWHRNIGIAIRQCPFDLQEASTQKVRSWINTMQSQGLSGLTINSKCSLLSGLIDRSIKSGLLEGWVNPFAGADYSVGEGAAQSIPTAEEKDYRGLRHLSSTLPDNQLIPILIQVYCGTRISEVRKRTAEDFDLEQGTMKITDAKNKSSERTIPLPPVVLNRLNSGFDYSWASYATINKKIQTINSALSSHSFRHGLTKLGRELQANEFAVEAMLGHRLSGSEQANTYGGKYGHKAMRKAVEPIWEQLNEWVKA